MPVKYKLRFNVENKDYDLICPSKKYPLPNNDAHVYTRDNTEEITDEKILDIIDTITFNLKKPSPYVSAIELFNAFLDNGINEDDFQLMTGWWFYPGGYWPDISTVLVYKKKHLIALNDFSEKGLKMVTKGMKGKTNFEARVIHEKNLKEMAKTLKNREYKMCCRLTNCIFVGAPVCEDYPDFYQKKNLYTGEDIEATELIEFKNISSIKNEN